MLQVLQFPPEFETGKRKRLRLIIICSMKLYSWNFTHETLLIDSSRIYYLTLLIDSSRIYYLTINCRSSCFSDGFFSWENNLIICNLTSKSWKSRESNLINQTYLISTLNIFTFASCDENIGKSDSLNSRSEKSLKIHRSFIWIKL